MVAEQARIMAEIEKKSQTLLKKAEELERLSRTEEAAEIRDQIDFLKEDELQELKERKG